jgi:hypothetical protein
MEGRHFTLLSFLVFLGLFCGVALSAQSNNLVFTVIGDWGVPSVPFTDKIAQVSKAKGSQFTVALGDNFYKGVSIGGKQHGVSSTKDPKWKSVFEDQFHQPFFRKRWYVIAGNHDYDGNEMAQVRYTKKSKRWYFPSLYYTFPKRLSKKDVVQFFMLDTHVLWSTDRGLEAYGRKKDLKQLAWIEKQLKKSKATWKIVFGHHPIYTSKGKSEWLVKKLVPLFHKYKVAAYVNGHVHVFQHVKSPKLDYFTVGSTGIQGTLPVKSGGGIKHGFTYPTESQINTPQCANLACRGFAIMKVKGSKTMNLQFFNTRGELVYTSPDIKNPK